MFEEKYNKRIIPPYVNTPIGRNVRRWFNKKNKKNVQNHYKQGRTGFFNLMCNTYCE